MITKKKILDVGVTSSTKNEVLEFLIKNIKTPSKKITIVTPNPEILVYAHSHSDFKHILNEATLALPDGVGLSYAGRFLGASLEDRISGTDFMEDLCSVSEENGFTVGFLGGRNQVAEKAVNRLKKYYPTLKVGFIGEESAEIEAKNIKLDILFVAFGFPKQEEWIANHSESLSTTVMMGVGGAFDYISGNVQRAPTWIRSMGFEWLFRLIIQPWRAKRQLALIVFICLVIQEKMRKGPFFKQN